MDGESYLAHQDKAQKRDVAKFMLEMSPEQFQSSKISFINGLAELLDISPTEIFITTIRSGCVVVQIDLPSDAQEKLLELWEKRSDSDTLADFINDYDVESIKFYVVPTGLGYPNFNWSNRSLTWLHLSDLHLRSEPGSKKFAQDDVTESFLEKLPILLKRWRLEPDFVFFTGDVAYSGRRTEYSVANEFFNSLLDVLPKQPRFFLVPGNHDVDWRKVKPHYEAQLRGELNETEKVNSFLLDEEKLDDREATFNRLDNYFEFINNSVPGGHVPLNRGFYYHTILQLDDNHTTVGIGGLNSAWCSTRKDTKQGGPKYDKDINQLLLGEPQVKETLQSLNEASIKIALVHHPPFTMWYKDFDLNMQKIRFGDFDFVLWGHLHKEEIIESKNLLTERSLYSSGAGALYLSRDYPNTCNVVCIDLDTGSGIIFYWSYSYGFLTWRVHTGPSDYGYREFQLSEKLKSRVRVQ